MSEPFFTSLVYGRSFASLPLTCFLSPGQRPAVVFASGPDGAGAAYLRRLREELTKNKAGSFRKLDLSLFFSLRRAAFFDDPFPDARFIEAGMPESHPLYARVQSLRARQSDPWRANARGALPEKNFNYRFSSRAASDYAGAYPESEPESRAFACCLRRLSVRRLVFLYAGEGFALPRQREEDALRALCEKQCPYPEFFPDFSGSPEGWAVQELHCAALRLSLPDPFEDRIYERLRPLLSALFAF